MRRRMWMALEGSKDRRVAMGVDVQGGRTCVQEPEEGKALIQKVFARSPSFKVLIDIKATFQKFSQNENLCFLQNDLLQIYQK
jgi:hypothetical protein